MKENKRPAVKDSADHDLDDFVTKPGPSKKARFAKPLSKKQMYDLEKGPVMLNTDKSIAWALRPSLTGAMREINVLLSKQNVLLTCYKTQTPRNWITGYLTSSWKPLVSRTLHGCTTYCLLVYYAMGTLRRSSVLTSWIRTILISMNYLVLVTPLHNSYARTVLVLQLNMQPLSLRRRKPCYWIKESWAFTAQSFSASCVLLRWKSLLPTTWCQAEISQTITIRVWLQPWLIHLHGEWLQEPSGWLWDSSWLKQGCHCLPYFGWKFQWPVMRCGELAGLFSKFL